MLIACRVHRYKDYEARYREGSHSDMPSQMTPLLVAPGGEKSGGTYTTYAGIGGDDWDKRSSDAGKNELPLSSADHMQFPIC
jgi:hypothetical protein